MKNKIMSIIAVSAIILLGALLVYSSAADKHSAKTRRILFYRNPMNPAITSKVPAKDEMGMDYVPVYEEENEDIEGGEEEEAVVSRVKIAAQEAQRAGVESKPLEKRHLFKNIRTIGIVAYDPQLAIAQQEFISSIRALDKMEKSNIPEVRERALGLVESSKRKLKLLGLSEKQINELENKREIQSNLILPEKTMWIYGDLYEYELPWLKEGQKVEVASQGLPGEIFEGIVSSVNPVLDPKTRSVKFRAEINNPDLRLKPQMYVDIVIKSMYTGPEGEHMVLAVPKDAVLDTGLKKIVWVDKGNSGYEGRIVEVGPEASATVGRQEERFYPVLRGLREGEKVITRSNFLIDSQSQITGVSAAAYGGALGVEEKKSAPAHSH